MHMICAAYARQLQAAQIAHAGCACEGNLFCCMSLQNPLQHHRNSWLQGAGRQTAASLMMWPNQARLQLRWQLTAA